MTMRTQYPMTCDCGHKGFLKLRENDQPYSKGWEKYSLVGFYGGEYSVEGAASFDDAIKAMKPTCPECKKELTIQNMD